MNSETVPLYYEEVGQGLPIVLLHGYPLNHTIWKPVADLLQDRARVIMPDLRGHGRSPVGEGEPSIRQMAEDVYALLEKLSIDRAIVVGQSMGGYVALSFAHAYPRLLAGLGLIATQAEADTPEKRQARLQTASEVKRRSLKGVLAAMPPKMSPRADIQAATHAIIADASRAGVIYALKAMADRPAALDWLTEIEVPAVVVSGLQDAFMPHERGITLAQMLGRAWLVELPDAGHMPMLEEPRAVADALLQVLDCVQTPGCQG